MQRFGLVFRQSLEDIGNNPPVEATAHDEVETECGGSMSLRRRAAVWNASGNVVYHAGMSTSGKTEGPMIEQRGTPRELAERMARMPEGQYRIFVQRVRSRDEILADFERTTQEMRRNPPAETAGMTDDEAMDWADQMVQEVRRSNRPEN